MEIELENPFGLHAPARLCMDPRLDVAALLERARQEHGLDCHRLLYRGRLLKPSEILGKFIEPNLTNKLLTHVSDSNLRTNSPTSTASSSPRRLPAGSAAGRFANPITLNRHPGPGFWQQFRHYIDLSLLGRLAFFVIVLGSDAGRTRRIVLFALATIIYIYQIAFRTPPRPENNIFQGPIMPPASAQGFTPEPDQLNPVQLTERFLVGLFASLYPGWEPN